jgi:hypothetical protein
MNFQPLSEQTGRQLLRELKILNQRRPATAKWVKVGVLKERTGWDGNRLKKAKRNGEVEFRSKSGACEYNLQSIDPVHLKTQVS